MIATTDVPGRISIRTALAIINDTANPALRYDDTHVAAMNLALIIERQTQVTELLRALHSLLFHAGEAKGELSPPAAQAARACGKAVLNRLAYALNSAADRPLPVTGPMSRLAGDPV